MTNKAKADCYLVVVSLAGGLCLASMLSRVAPSRYAELLYVLPVYWPLSQMTSRLPSGVRIAPAYPIIAAALVNLGAGLAALMCGARFLTLLFKRERLLYATYVFGQLTISCWGAGLAYRLAGGVYGHLALPACIPAFLALGLAFDALNIGFAQGRVWLQEGTSGGFLARWWRSLTVERGWATPVYHSLGMLAAILLLDRGPWGLVVTVLPLVGLHAFCRLFAEVDEARQSALTDRLTGIGNYRALTDWFATHFERLIAGSQPLSVLWLDADDLKQINDSLGHEAGNAVLKSIAQAILANTRGTDMVCRYGGDEFVVVLTDTGPEQARAIATRIQEAARLTPLEFDGVPLVASLSFGLASYPEHGSTMHGLLAASDQAMYDAKQLKGQTLADAPLG